MKCNEWRAFALTIASIYYEENVKNFPSVNYPAQRLTVPLADLGWEGKVYNCEGNLTSLLLSQT